MNEIAGAILAGGKSSRMGTDKASLRLYGKTFLQCMESILREGNIEDIYISHKDVIPDDIPEYGPLSGIHAILNNIPKQYNKIVFVPIDMPRLTALLIKKLISVPSKAPLIHFKSYKMPFLLRRTGQWLTLAEKLLQNGKDVSLETFQKNIRCTFQIIPSSTEQKCFLNINTSEEWRAFAGGKKL